MSSPVFLECAHYQKRHGAMCETDNNMLYIQLYCLNYNILTNVMSFLENNCTNQYHHLWDQINMYLL